MAMTKPAREAHDRYRGKIDKMNEQIRKLQGEIQEGERQIVELNEKHKAHLNAFESPAAEEVRGEITKLEDLQKARRSQVEYFQDPAHPLRQQAKNDYLAELDQERRRLIEEYAGIHDELTEAREAFIEKVAEYGHYSGDLYTVALAEFNASGRSGQMPVPSGIPSFVAYEVYQDDFKKAMDRQPQV